MADPAAVGEAGWIVNAFLHLLNTIIVNMTIIISEKKKGRKNSTFIAKIPRYGTQVHKKLISYFPA